MKTVFTIAAALLAAPLVAQPPVSLPGVADEETTFHLDGVTKFHRGAGDVLFVSDRTGRWYRLGLNEGCLRNVPRIHTLTFQARNPVLSQKVDRFASVRIHRTGSGTMSHDCEIDSIRRSEPPPQVNSQSRVTLD